LTAKLFGLLTFCGGPGRALSFNFIEQQFAGERAVLPLFTGRLTFDLRSSGTMHQHDAGRSFIYVLAAMPAGADEGFFNVFFPHSETGHALRELSFLFHTDGQRAHASSVVGDDSHRNRHNILRRAAVNRVESAQPLPKVEGRNNFMPQHKLGARAEYRQKEGQRIIESPTLAIKYPKLKSLKVNLEFFPPESEVRSSQIKYVVNLDHAKSIFRFDCLNKECIRGDFDLTEVLAAAIASKKKVVTGELRCAGWRNKESIKTMVCRNVLKYKFNLGY